MGMNGILEEGHFRFLVREWCTDKLEKIIGMEKVQAAHEWNFGGFPKVSNDVVIAHCLALPSPPGNEIFSAVKSFSAAIQMLLRRKSHHLHINTFPFSASPPTLKPDWREKIKHAQFVNQISTILTQRNPAHWPSLLKPFHLNSNLTAPLFLQILRHTQPHPPISLTFFNYAKKNLGFKPDLKTQCRLAVILSRSGLPNQSKTILDSLVQAYPATQIVSSLVKGTDFDKIDTFSSLFSSLLECYCNKGLYMQGLEVYRRGKECGYLVPVHICNALLSILLEKNEVKMFWCFLGLIIRDGVSGNLLTWSLIAQALGKDGKFEMIIKILDMGMHSPVMYNLVIEGYSKRGDFKAAFYNLNEMCNEGFNPSFSTFSFILDGACEYRDVKVIDEVVNSMVGKGYLPELVIEEYDSVIQKFAHLGRTFAAELFYRRVMEEKIELQGTTYGSILRAFSKAGRVMDAIKLYDFIVTKKFEINDNKYFYSFLNVLCEENPSEDISRLLKDLIERGLSPSVDQMSKYISSQCEKRRWKEAEELLNVIINNGILPNAICFSSLVKHYCLSKRISSAISLHTKMEVLDGAFDITTYTVLLNGLFREKRIEDAIRIFDYMRTHNVLSSDSFSIIIRGLCLENNFRKAMSLHDEMLKLGLKPDRKKYKHLISGFK
nr:pentatricopeptide repeat-containing protein At4g21170 [Ipomoea trifida]